MWHVSCLRLNVNNVRISFRSLLWQSVILRSCCSTKNLKMHIFLSVCIIIHSARIEPFASSSAIVHLITLMKREEIKRLWIVCFCFCPAGVLIYVGSRQNPVLQIKHRFLPTEAVLLRPSGPAHLTQVTQDFHVSSHLSSRTLTFPTNTSPAGQAPL